MRKNQKCHPPDYFEPPSSWRGGTRRLRSFRDKCHSNSYHGALRKPTTHFGEVPLAEKFTSGQKTARTKKRRKAAKKAVRTRTMRQAGFKAADTRKRNQMIMAVNAGLQAA